MKKTLAALALTSVMSSAASAATYVQYVAQFSGMRAESSRTFAPPPPPYAIYEKVTINISQPVDASTTSIHYYFNGSADVTYGPTGSSILVYSYPDPEVREIISFALPAATSGGLTDFESAISGSYNLNNNAPGGYADIQMKLDSFTTNFSSTPFTGGDVTVDTIRAVPEPATWAMFIGGFGLIGGTMRRKKVSVSFT